MLKRSEGTAVRARRVPDADIAMPDLGLLEQSVGYQLRRAQLAIFARVTEGMSEHHLKPGQVGVLMVIDRNPGLTQAEVCTALGIQRANLVTLINHLEHRGVVERHAVEADRRANALHLTDKGRRVLRKAIEVHRRIESAITRRLGLAERDRLLKVLNRLAAT